MDPFLKPVTVQWGRQTSQQSVAGAYKNTVMEESVSALVTSERGGPHSVQGEEIPQKGHYLKRIFKKQKFTRQMREGKNRSEFKSEDFLPSCMEGWKKLVACLYFRIQQV